MRINQVISSVVSDRPERLAVSNLVNKSQEFALAYLWQKARKQRLLGNMFRMSMEDLALDCIAELFQRDDNGRFDQIHAYFEGIRWYKMNDDELNVALRRLIFSKVNEGLFRRYREADPALAKIIRNIKNAVKANARLSLQRIKSELLIVVTAHDPNQPFLPSAPSELIENHLISCLSNTKNDNLRILVDAFADFVDAHPYYRNSFPLTGFAQIVRSAFVCVGEQPQETEADSFFLPGQIGYAIDGAVKDVFSNMQASYVGKGKVDLDTFMIYADTVRDILAEQFVSEARPVDSYFDALKHYIVDLTPDSYRNEHRHILEYLVKITRKNLLGNLRSELVN